MANSVGNVIFTQGDLNKRLEEWMNSPNNSTNPAVSILKCLPTCEYTNQDYISIKNSLDEIISESQYYESKRILNKAIELKDLLVKVECMGEDMCLLFNGYFQEAKEFIDLWILEKDNQILESSVTQNPNYYNN